MGKNKANESGKKRTASYEVWCRLKKNRLAVISMFVLGFIILIGIFGELIAPYPYAEQDPNAIRLAPCAAHWLGTDQYGRDLLSRLLVGTRYSLSVAVVSVAIGAVFGTTLGLIAAFYEKVDNLIMRILDIFMGIPTMILCIALVSMLGPGLVKVMIAVGIAYIPKFARLIRSSVLTTKDMEYVESARSIGMTDSQIIIHHILPNSFSPMLVQCTLAACQAIIWSASLSFIGLGVQPPTPEWGCLLSEGKLLIQVAPWLSIFPGVAIILTTYALNILGDGLRDALDPRLRR